MVSRLFQIVYLLMERESITASELAEKLEVSVRTINRDIEKLSEARIPIYATRGRSGGISLLSDFVLNKKVLSEEEKSGILSSMKVLGTVAYEDEQQALTRLEEFFGTSAQDWIEVELDNWTEGSFDKDKFKVTKDAILHRKKLEFDYSGHGKCTHRTVRPGKLYFKGQAWYLYAYCELRKDYRYFKLRRIINLAVLEDQFETLIFPVKTESNYAYNEEEFNITISVDKTMAFRVYDEIPSKSISELDDRLVITIPNAKRSWFFDYILSYGPTAIVLEPECIRNEIASKIKQMYENYY